MKVIWVLGAALSLALASSAHAAITVDGNLDAAYGAATSSVAYDAGADTGNFGQPGHPPGSKTNAIAYNIYLHEDGGTVYGFIQGTGAGTPVGSFANVYFDISGSDLGSDLGFEISPSHQDVFIPGVFGSNVDVPIANAASLDGKSFEFAIPDSYFTGPIAGVTYPGGQQFTQAGGELTLRLSQSLGYSVAGGPGYGEERLGTINLAGGVPEPATWAMMLVGFGGLGAMLRRRRAQATFAAA